MRLGVFGKIGLAFGVLLLAFAGYATFTLLSVVSVLEPAAKRKTLASPSCPSIEPVR